MGTLNLELKENGAKKEGENTGSLDQIVKIDGKIVNGTYKDCFKLTIEEGKDILQTTNVFRLNAGEEKTIKLKLKPDEEKLDNNQRGKKFEFDSSFGDITLTGYQVNADVRELSQ